MFMEMATTKRYCLNYPVLAVALLLSTNGVAQESKADASTAASAKPAVGGGAKASADTPPPSLNECLSIHREAQALRKQYRLLESRDLMMECSHEACPAPVKRDCVRWADEVAAQLPSIVFRMEGGDSIPWDQLKIFIDDELLSSSMHNRAVELNPGTHRLKFVLEGKPTLEREVSAGEGEKYKPIIVKFESGNQLGGPQAGQTGTQQTAVGNTTNSGAPILAPAQQSRPVPTATYVFAGIGVAAAANFAVWGLLHRSLYNELERECAPDCEQSYVDKVRTRGLVADISLGVSVASFATAGVLYLIRPTVTIPDQVRVGPLPHGGFIGMVRLGEF
jgi:hypothetical protein